VLKSLVDVLRETSAYGSHRSAALQVMDTVPGNTGHTHVPVALGVLLHPMLSQRQHGP